MLSVELVSWNKEVKFWVSIPSMIAIQEVEELTMVSLIKTHTYLELSHCRHEEWRETLVRVRERVEDEGWEQQLLPKMNPNPKMIVRFFGKKTVDESGPKAQEEREEFIEKLIWTLIEAGREGEDELDQMTIGEVRVVALTHLRVQRTPQVLFNTTLKEREARQLMLLKSMMDGSLDKDKVAALQTEDGDLVQMLKEEKLVLHQGLMMKEGNEGVMQVALPDWLGDIIAENLHYCLLYHRPASSIQKTTASYYFTPNLKTIIDKVCNGCGLCLLESKIARKKGMGMEMTTSTQVR